MDNRRLVLRAQVALLTVLMAACGSAIVTVGQSTTTSTPRPGPAPTVPSPSPPPRESIATTAPGPPPALPAPTTTTRVPTSDLELTLVERITGDISPKSVVHSGTGLFFAQNMMYRHSITVYDRQFDLVATIPDAVDLAEFGEDVGGEEYQGAPVEAAFTSDGRYAYVTNYQMYGDGYTNAGGDACDRGAWDESFVYRVDTQTLAIDQVIGVGAVPKFIAVTPDDSTVLVTNWCTFDMSVIDVATGTETGRVALGRHPRGIAVTSDSSIAYVAVMGSHDVAAVSLAGLSVEWISGVGANPRHVVVSPDDAFLYVTLNGEGTTAKVDVATREVIGKVVSGRAPRSMVMSDDGLSLYIVNYGSDTVSKVLTEDLTVAQTLAVDQHPIGITFDAEERNVWVANYSGSIMVFEETP